MLKMIKSKDFYVLLLGRLITNFGDSLYPLGLSDEWVYCIFRYNPVSNIINSHCSITSKPNLG